MSYSLLKLLSAAAGIALLALSAFGSTPATASVMLNCGDGSSDFGTDCSLGELVAGGSIIIDDKRFDNWRFFTGDSVGSPDAIVTDPALIRVDPIGEGTLDPGPGLKYTATGGAWSATFPKFDLDTIYFDVTTTDGLARISDNELQFTPGQVDAGYYTPSEPYYGLVGIAELVAGPPGFDQFGNPIGPQLASKGVGYAPLFGPATLVDSATFGSPQSSISVYMSLNIKAGLIPPSPYTNGIAEILSIEQNFSQVAATTTGIPEPGTFALFGVGLAGLGFARRRKAAARHQG